MKTHAIILCVPTNTKESCDSYDLFVNNVKITRVTSIKHLGLILDDKHNFNNHIQSVQENCSIKHSSSLLK